MLFILICIFCFQQFLFCESQITKTINFPNVDKLATVPKEKQREFVCKIEQYMNNISMLSCDFTQAVVYKRKLQMSNGKLYYTNIDSVNVKICLPDLLLFVKNGVIIVIDTNKKSVSRYSMDYIPITSIFSKQFNVEKNFHSYVVHCDEDSHTIYITLKTIGATEIVLMFHLYTNTNIKCLAGWSIKDEQRRVTNVIFDQKSLEVNNSNSFPKDTFDLPAVCK
ncbi:MAG: hypothetical protein LBD36_00775 [Holosporales bacterium]|jgi:uncharacterized protein YlzI (FlbEa/FlbD family)|nr:hypothetical protein [Holosporales bacterium]